MQKMGRLFTARQEDDKLSLKKSKIEAKNICVSVADSPEKLFRVI